MFACVFNPEPNKKKTTIQSSSFSQNGKKMQQTMEEPLQLFTSELMDKLVDSNTTSISAEEYLAAHFRALGCLDPDEQTRGAAAAIWAYAAVQRSGIFPSYDGIHQCVQRFGELGRQLRVIGSELTRLRVT